MTDDCSQSLVCWSQN